MSYYSQAEYIEEFGENEAVRLTDEDGTGGPDPYAFAKAIAHADAVIDSYLAARYSLPLSATPPLLTAIASALVRERLHGTFPTEAVTKAADLARRQLGDLSTGKATLILPDASEPPANTSGPDGITVLQPLERVFSAAALAKY